MKKKKILIISLVLLAIMAVALVLILLLTPPEEPAEPATAQKLVGLLYDGALEEVKEAFETLCEEQNWALMASEATTLAIPNAEALIKRNVDILIVGGAQKKELPRIVSLANEAGIPVITLDQEHENAMMYGINVQQAGELLGKSAGDAAKKDLGGGDMILCLGESSAEPEILRVARTKVQQITGVDEEYIIYSGGGKNRDHAKEEIIRRLQDSPSREKVVILCASDEYAVGALEAVNELGYTQKAVIGSYFYSKTAHNVLGKEASAWQGSVAWFADSYANGLFNMVRRVLENDVQDIQPAYVPLVWMDTNNAKDSFG